MLGREARLLLAVALLTWASCAGLIHPQEKGKPGKGLALFGGEHVHVVLMFCLSEKSTSLSKATVPVILSKFCVVSHKT